MLKSAARRSDVLEREWSQSIGLLGGGILLIVLAGVVFYFTYMGHFVIPRTANTVAQPGTYNTVNDPRYFTHQSNVAFADFLAQHAALLWLLDLLGMVMLVSGLGLCLTAAKRGIFAPRMPTIPFLCPYCDGETMLLAEPTTDFTCDHCDRQIHFENGVLVPVRHIVCPACRAEHRVAINVQRFVCDRCNRALQISADKPITLAPTTQEGSDGEARNFDVLLVAYDHRQESTVAFKVQNLLVVNMKEARRLLHTASSSAPLIVAQNEPELKAESIRRQLQELGATATLRPTTVGKPAARGAR
jgi:ribosomal protein L7/L12